MDTYLSSYLDKGYVDRRVTTENMDQPMCHRHYTLNKIDFLLYF